MRVALFLGVLAFFGTGHVFLTEDLKQCSDNDNGVLHAKDGQDDICFEKYCENNELKLNLTKCTEICQIGFKSIFVKNKCCPICVKEEEDFPDPNAFISKENIEEYLEDSEEQDELSLDESSYDSEDDSNEKNVVISDDDVPLESQDINNFILDDAQSKGIKGDVGEEGVHGLPGLPGRMLIELTSPPAL